MLLKLRLSMPDLRGWLAKVARTIAIAGADIVQVVVIERRADRAIDEFTLFCADEWGRDRLLDALGGLPGVTVEGIWPTHWLPDANTELDLLAAIAAEPAHAIEHLVDAVPVIAHVDWAVVFADQHGHVRYASPAAPAELAPPRRPARVAAATLEGGVLAAVVPVPSSESSLVAGRSDGPAFHAVELKRLERLVEIAEIIRSASAPALLRQ